MKKTFFLLIFPLFFSLLCLPGQAAEIDSDGDGLSDQMEDKFKSDKDNPDSDGDGYKDGLEVSNGYNPLQGEGAKLNKKIEVSIKSQKLAYYLGDVRLGEYPVSTGKKSTPTPKGEFEVRNKLLRPKSQAYKVYMPYWLGLNAAGIGIHELPEWGKNQKEPATSLGTPASHGCIRLGVGPAKIIYDFAEPGTKVKIY